MTNPKPCPFCGGTKIKVIEGETFRWRKAQCQECQAASSDVRVDFGANDLEERIAAAEVEALNVWNHRVSEQQQPTIPMLGVLQNPAIPLKGM